MNTHQKQDRELRFVLHHYQKGKFDTRRAMAPLLSPQRGDGGAVLPPFGGMRGGLSLSLRKIAAVAAMLVVLVGAFAFYYHITYPAHPNTQHPSPSTQHPTPNTQQPSTAFHFENTPINEALREVGQRYGVQLTASDTTRCITGDFETDDLPTLIDLIEETLDIDIPH